MIINTDDPVECVTHSTTVIALALVGILAILARVGSNESATLEVAVWKSTTGRVATLPSTDSRHRDAIVCIRVLEQTTEFVSVRVETQFPQPIFAILTPIYIDLCKLVFFRNPSSNAGMTEGGCRQREINLPQPLLIFGRPEASAR
jgi:hypothetical protein